MASSPINTYNMQSAYANKVGASYYIPEPSTTGTGVFGDVMGVALSAAKSLVGGGGVTAPASSEFMDLINQQIEIQKEMQLTSMMSNIEKSKHETAMAPIRNMRVS